jgi:hypothetical protein
LRDGGLLLRLARLNVEDQVRGHRVTLKDNHIKVDGAAL